MQKAPEIHIHTLSKTNNPRTKKTPSKLKKQTNKQKLYEPTGCELNPCPIS